MAQFGGLQGLGAPINYYDQMVPDFRGEALKVSQANAMDVQSRARQQEMAQQQKDEARKQQFYDFMKTAKPEDLPKARQQFPDFAQSIQQEIGIQDEEHARFVNKSLNNIAIARASGDPRMMQDAIQKSAPALASINMSPDQAMQLLQSDPQSFDGILRGAQLATLPFEKQVDVGQKQQQLDETARSNRAGESLTARGQDITARGQDISASTARRGQDMAYKRAGLSAGPGSRVVQLADGRTVSVGGKLHGAGANAFYEGVDDDGNMVRVPANAIAAPPTSAATAQNYAMKKDLDAISGASSDQLGFMTGITGGNGSPSWDAEVRSRWSGGDRRQLYNATKRIQGKMQNQGIAAARDMGASGINTVAEAKMYFQGMPQVDYSSPEAMQQSVRDIQQYTDNYNQQYQVNVGGGGRQSTTQQPAAQQPTGGSYTSKSGITFTVK